MLEITTTTGKNGIQYANVDFRRLNDGEGVDVTLLYDRPRDLVSKFGTTKIFALNYLGQRVSVMVPQSAKSPDFNITFGQMLARFKRGDVVRVTKLAGTSKAGRAFNYFNAMK